MMPYSKTNKSSTQSKVVASSRPALTPEARENQMIALSVDLAERQLREGTASSQVITHFLKLGSSKERLEQLKMEKEIELLKAKTEASKNSGSSEELYKKALRAMKAYSGAGDMDDENKDEY